MAKKKKKTGRSRSAGKESNSDLDAWIERNQTNKGGTCPLCEPKTLEELKKMEKRLRLKKKRVPLAAIWRRLAEMKLINFSQREMGKKLQKPCHLKFYKYIKGLE